MREYYSDESVTIYHGDNKDFTGTADVVITDPPYGLSFMSRTWDGVVPDASVWGRFDAGWLFAFGGTRTWHRLACAIEDSGWQIRDTMMWLYGQGFPKGKNNLKPAWEPIIVARKYGDLDIDAARIGADTVATRVAGGKGFGANMRDDNWQPPTESYTSTHQGRWPANLILDEEAGRMLDEQSGESTSVTRSPTGRGILDPERGWNNNHMVDKTVRGFSDSGGASRYFYCAKASKAERNYGLDSTRTVKYNVPIKGALCQDVSTALVDLLKKATSDSGTRWTIEGSGASITGLCPSDSLSTTLTAISRITTSEICDSLTPSLTSAFTQAVNYEMACGGSLAASAESSSELIPTTMSGSQVESARGARLVVSQMLSQISDGANWTPFTNTHPTIKPLKLMEWLIKLSGGQTILDPFMGSGTTLVAAKRLGRHAIGIEIDEHSCEIAANRCRATMI
jgi:site-specific DNA-methyltransferase (adenine-specific)